MKNIYILFLSIAGMFLITSCNDEIPKTLTGQYVGIDNSNTTFIYLRAGNNQPVDLDAKVNLIAVPQASAINYSFEIVDSLTTAIENLHYNLLSTTGSISPNETSALMPIQINPDNIDEDENISITVVLTSADVQLANRNPVTYNISVTCESNLAGMVNYESFDNFAMATLTGTTEFKIFNNTPGVYLIGDFSFGTWEEAYNIDPPTGTVRFFHLCGKVSLSGTDNYNENWNMDELLESNGPVLSFIWSNTYGEFGTVRLTRLDGTNWPPMTL